jgi:peroxiredoxin family protein
MSTETSQPASERQSEEELRARVEELEAQVAELADLEATVADMADDGSKKMTIVATQGSFDMAYPPLILASTAAAFDWEVVVFHTFWGLDILHEEKSQDLKLSAVGNPNMSVPNAVAAVPGMDRLATHMMERRIEDNDTATIEELIDLSLDQGVELQACQMTIDLLGYDEEAFYDGVTVGVGAATALQHMAESDIQLLV